MTFYSKYLGSQNHLYPCPKMPDAENRMASKLRSKKVTNN